MPSNLRLADAPTCSIQARHALRPAMSPPFDYAFCLEYYPNASQILPGDKVAAEAFFACPEDASVRPRESGELAVAVDPGRCV